MFKYKLFLLTFLVTLPLMASCPKVHFYDGLDFSHNVKKSFGRGIEDFRDTDLPVNSVVVNLEQGLKVARRGSNYYLVEAEDVVSFTKKHSTTVQLVTGNLENVNVFCDISLREFEGKCCYFNIHNSGYGINVDSLSIIGSTFHFGNDSRVEFCPCPNYGSDFMGLFNFSTSSFSGPKIPTESTVGESLKSISLSASSKDVHFDGKVNFLGENFSFNVFGECCVQMTFFSHLDISPFSSHQ